MYEFITRRFLACCSKDAKGWQTTVEVEYGGEEFYATGLTVMEKNYLVVYPYDKWSDNYIPDFQEGEEFQPSVCELRDGQTSKPSLLTEADLVSLMDKNGIGARMSIQVHQHCTHACAGTDATIAQHIETIVNRNYVIEHYEGQTKYLLPSVLGIGLIEGYSQIGLQKSLDKPQLRREARTTLVPCLDVVYAEFSPDGTPYGAGVPGRCDQGCNDGRKSRTVQTNIPNCARGIQQDYNGLYSVW